MADYYYYATAGGAKIWVRLSWQILGAVAYPQWKKYLTTMQIIQFVIDLCVVYFASESVLPPPSRSHHQSGFIRVLRACTNRTGYNHFAAKYTNLPYVSDCTGSEGAAIFGCALLSTYLFLFIT